MFQRHISFLTVQLLFVTKCVPLSIPEEIDAEDPNICGSYRELARLPNPYSFRGNTCCSCSCSENSTCFANDEHSPWGHISELPECLDKILPGFQFYTPESSDSFISLDYFNLSNSLTNFTDVNVVNSSRQFYTIIHGWNTKWAKSWIVPMKDALIELVSDVLRTGK